uniref:Uncharacterized protein n=1 Tax=Anguilla anguilla TaxID=7936 RepID=A0A0E9RIV5_ANGAN
MRCTCATCIPGTNSAKFGLHWFFEWLL